MSDSLVRGASTSAWSAHSVLMAPMDREGAVRVTAGGGPWVGGRGGMGGGGAGGGSATGAGGGVGGRWPRRAGGGGGGGLLGGRGARWRPGEGPPPHRSLTTIRR